MRFLDLDLDFFLNKNAYFSGSNSGRLGSGYKPWNVSKVQHFLEDRCGLSLDAPVQGRTVESHDGVLDFWRMLIESGRLRIPWVTLRKHLKSPPEWDGDARSILIQLKKRKCESSPIRDLPTIERERGVHFKILPWYKFRTSEIFDYIAMSRSPNFTPPESDELVPIIERYMKQI
jgi:hypothetical protein